jgi:predicted outer membrane repeat protein
MKNLADILKVCSVLPIFAVMPAMAAEYTVKAGESLAVTEGFSNAEKGVFQNNGSLTINDGLVFENNNTNGYGAVIYIFDKNATYTKIGDNVVFSGGAALEGTSADYSGMGGAIYTWSDGGKDGASGANVIEMGNDVVFRGNSSVDGSVMYTYGYNTITIGDNLVVEDNSSLGYGAIVLNGYDAFNGNDFINTMTVGKNALFQNNAALLRSGAVYIGGDANDKAVFDDGARFVGNTASYGGAVSGFGAFEFGDVSFDSNISYDAWEHFLKEWGWTEATYKRNCGNGGAVMNSGEFVITGDAVFTNNYAEGLGGAIYNNGNMTFDGDVKFSGNRNDVTIAFFEDDESLTGFVLGNVTGGKPNDIHNIGTLNILSGTTTLDGGITGDGTLTVAKDAVLNIGTATVEQAELNIKGTVLASVLSDRQHGRLLGEVKSGRDAKLELTVGSVGTYNIFDHDNNIEIVAGDAYVVTNNGAEGVVIETKAVEDLAADAGLTTNAAAVVAGLANSDVRAVQQVSLAAQVALNAGDIETIEKEAAKVAPDDKPVAQSIAMSVQNQVLNMAAGRMAAVAPMGRNGGDTVKEAGAWVQGMFNKSKLTDQFHSYTRGVALGGDTVINGVLTLGAGYANGTTDVYAAGRDTEIDSNTIFAYMQYKPSNWYMNTTLSYTMAEYEESTSVFGMPLVNAYDVDSYGAQLMTGYSFASGITPEMGMRFLNVSVDEYDNVLGTVAFEDTQYLTGVAGFKYGFQIESESDLKFSPEIRAAATYDFLSDDAIATITTPGAAAYVVESGRLSRLGGEFGIGFNAQYKGLNISLSYDLDLHKDYTSQTGMLKFRFNF